MRTSPAGRLFVAGVAAMIAAALPGTSRAAVHVDASIQVEQVARLSRADVEVWTNKEEGGVYRQGEPMRVFFRTSVDAFVLIYNIDTEGYIHLVYPYGPDDADRVQGGVTHQVPSRNDPYELVADGPTGIEYVVAIASPFPFRNLPWYLSGGYDGTRPDYNGDDGDSDESGVIVGDPYVGMDRVVRRVVPPGSEDDVATDDTFFYIERRVEYPRYVCADCHSYGGWYDPYVDVCSVVDVRIDASWARFRPLRSRVIRPRYFYMVRSTAPNRYRQWKDRWSSVDGRTTLRTRFQVDGQDKFRSRREAVQRRTPPEFQDLRRPRSGRTWSTPDQVLRRRERDNVQSRERSGVTGREDVRGRRGVPDSPDRSGAQRQRDMRNRDDARDQRGNARGQRDDARRRESQDRSQRRQDQERQIRERRQEERRPDPQTRERRQEERRPDPPPQARERREERRPDPPQARERREERPRDEQRQDDRGSRGDRGRGNDEQRRQDDGDRGRGRGHDRGR